MASAICPTSSNTPTTRGRIRDSVKCGQCVTAKAEEETFTILLGLPLTFMFCLFFNYNSKIQCGLDLLSKLRVII